MNLLAIDVGNTHIVLGIFKGRKLADEWRAESSGRITGSALWTHIKLFCAESGVSPGALDGVAIASVVPRLTDLLAALSKKRFRRTPLIISGKLDVGMTIRYDNPAALGADRLCNAVAGYEKSGGAVIIADFGTATTYDVVSKKGEYLGGIIAPGVETSAASLFHRAAKLPPVQLQFPKQLIGTNTVACLQSGIMFGARDSVDGMIRRLKREIGRNSRVIATGGFAGLMAERSTMIDSVEPELVLEGARIIFGRVKRG